MNNNIIISFLDDVLTKSHMMQSQATPTIDNPLESSRQCLSAHDFSRCWLETMSMRPCCPICCDDEKSSKNLKLLKCCRQRVCHDCMCEHIKNILQEGLTGDGSKTLLCPMGCGKDLTDKVIRSCIRQKYFSFRHHAIGMTIVNMLKNLVTCDVSRVGRHFNVPTCYCRA